MKNLSTHLRTHHCGELNLSHVETRVRLMGFIHLKRDMGGICFIDLRDHYGLTQILIKPDSTFYSLAQEIRVESVVAVEGTVKKRGGASNPKLKTGDIEIDVDYLELESMAEILPFPVAFNPKEEHEDTRLKYRYLDLRTEKMHSKILFYNSVIKAIRDEMHKQNFVEFQTPILTSSSPEGARDFLVPSRIHPGKFYALPQAPQQFKQLLMCSGFDRYFQIAPCFRDEDPRADRAPGEFYQLDVEMSFVTQEDVFKMAEELVTNLWKNFGAHKTMPKAPFQRMSWNEAMETYGTDKPDLRIDLPMKEVRDIFLQTTFSPFKNVLSVAKGTGVLKVLVVPKGASMSRKFFEEGEALVKEMGLGGLPWLSLKDGEWKGSCAKVLSDAEKNALKNETDLQDGDACFFIIGLDRLKCLKAGGKLRLWVADKMQLIKKDVWAFLWVVDFPMYEWSEEEQKMDFSHNPFSMPQGGLEAIKNKDPLDIFAYQYDLVCNGYELASGAIRNHRKEVMQAVFEVAGYTKEEVENRFGALWNAFNYGPPPHGGMAIGIARVVMLFLDELNIREVIAFPMNGKAVDVLMGAPNVVREKQLEEAHIAIRVKKTVED